MLRVETPPEDQDTVPEIVFAGSVAGCDDVIDHHCNPQLAIGGGTIHAAVLRYASLSRTGGPLAEAAGEATYSATLDAPTTLDVVV